MTIPMAQEHPPLGEPVVELDAVTFAFDRHPVLEEVSLSIRQFDSVCVVGPNGGGKSTLVKIILGLLAPGQGAVRLLGGPPEETRNRVGYVPQFALYDPRFPVTVLDVALMGRLGVGHGFRYRRSDRDQAMAALAEMGLADLARRGFAELSGGQRQRVLIARALASASEMLILDEPTANVDAQAEVGLMEILTGLKRRMAILLVTHDLGFASQFFRSVVCVNHRVHVHPTSEITGQRIQELYGGDMAMIRHDHRCAAGGHSC